MMLLAIQLLAVGVPGVYLAWRCLPLAGPGRLAFCLGIGSILALVITGAVMWLVLISSGQILPWVPVLVMVLAAGLAALLGRRAPCRPGPAPIAAGSIQATAPRWQQVLVLVLLGLMVLRLFSLLPDVLLRPLFAWDAWTVWAFEARLWFELGRYVELLAPGEWLTAVPEAFVRDNLALYPRLVPGLILWAVAGQSEWTGVGPGLLWLSAAVATALVLYGVLRLAGRTRLVALAAAYAFFSLPLVNVQVSLYGYADLWLSALLAVFAACLVLAERDGRRLWQVLAVLVLLLLPLVKAEGLYWLVCGLTALLAARLRLGTRLLMLLGLAGIGLVHAALYFGVDLLAWVSLGRLQASAAAAGPALANSARHLLVWFDWHLLGYGLLAALVVLARHPRLADSMRALSAFCILGCLLLGGLTPLTVAGEFLAMGTLFSRILLQLAPTLLLFVTLLGTALWQAPARTELPAMPAGPNAAAMGVAMVAAMVLVWGSLGVWAVTDFGSRQLMPPRVIAPDASRWRLAEGQGGLTDEGFRVHAPGRFGRVDLRVELPDKLPAEEYDRVRLRFSGAVPDRLALGWSRQRSLQPGLSVPMEATDSNIAEVHLASQQDWHGELYWLAIEQLGFSSGPWTLAAIELPLTATGFMGFQKHWWRSLRVTRPWQTARINSIAPSGSHAVASPVLVMAFWVVLALMLWWGFSRRARHLAPWAALVLVGFAWLALDVRWQFELAHKANLTRMAFAGQLPAERLARDMDGELHTFLQRLHAQHPRSAFQKVFAVGEEDYWRKRARYHLASWGVRPLAASALTDSVISSLQSGDLLLLLDAPDINVRVISSSGGVEQVELRVRGQESRLLGERLLRQSGWSAVRIR